MGLTRETETDIYGPSLLAQWSRIPLPRKETQVSSLGPEDPLEEEMATHSGIPAWEIPWTEEPGGLQSMGSQESDMIQQLHHHVRECRMLEGHRERV